MESLRIGRIGFANCTPIFRALEEDKSAGGLSFIKGVPTELNKMLREGLIDISPSSSFEYLDNQELYGFLPDLSISSIGEVASVLLFSKVPLEKLDGARVALTPASATSVALLKVMLEGMMDIKPEYTGMDGETEAVLLIGDEALRVAKEGKWPLVYDLGKLWFDQTSTPFVFALWIARRDRFEEKPEAFVKLYRHLIAARQRAYRSFARYAADAEEAKWLGVEGLVDYWQTISYDLTAWHLRGLGIFAEEAKKLGLIEESLPLRPLGVA
jgi:chorismate dehydratase